MLERLFQGFKERRKRPYLEYESIDLAEARYSKLLSEKKLSGENAERIKFLLDYGIVPQRRWLVVLGLRSPFGSISSSGL